LQAWEAEPKWQETGRSGSGTAGQGGTTREPGQMSRNQAGKPSDEGPGKTPRLNSAVGRTKMEMEDAKMSGISFLQKSDLY